MSHDEFIRHKIAVRRYQLLKKQALVGKSIAQHDAADFLQNFFHISSKIIQIKIDVIISQAQKIIQTQLQNNPNLIVAMTEKLFKNIAEHTDIEITAHPLDAQILRDHVLSHVMQSASVRRVSVSDDASFERGSLSLKANKSIIDAHIKTQTNNARQRLLQRVGFHDGHAY